MTVAVVTACSQAATRGGGYLVAELVWLHCRCEFAGEHQHGQPDLGSAQVVAWLGDNGAGGGCGERRQAGQVPCDHGGPGCGFFPVERGCQGDQLGVLPGLAPAPCPGRSAQPQSQSLGKART